MSGNGLYVVDAITGQVKALARPLKNLWSRAAWSPDGRWIRSDGLLRPGADLQCQSTAA